MNTDLLSGPVVSPVLCPRCNYDITNLLVDAKATCPECGLGIDSRSIVPRWRSRCKAIVIGHLVLCICGLVALGILLSSSLYSYLEPYLYSGIAIASLLGWLIVYAAMRREGKAVGGAKRYGLLALSGVVAIGSGVCGCFFVLLRSMADI